MKRREFLTRAGIGALAASSLTACGGDSEPTTASPTAGAAEVTQWRMVTTWPKNFPGLGTGAENIARYINEMSGGRLTVEVLGAGEVVPALEVFDAVQAGTAEMGHGGAYYWQGKIPAAPFFSAVPFGFTAQEMNSWLLYGGGLELWQELYAPFGVLPMPGGNTGVQMAGWFREPIESIEDFEGLKIRLPGIAGEVLRRLGATVVNIPGGELFQALNDGTIDAAEWVGPYNDLAFGFYRAARYYYGPGWNEPGTTLEAIINREAFDALPGDLQQIVLTACKAANADMLAEYTARNHNALRQLVDDHGVLMRQFPQPVLEALFEASRVVIAELVERDEFARRAHESFSRFLGEVRPWTQVSEFDYLRARAAL
ncbi:MAG: TRAP transporter substrate-binding protein [Halothiobacillaceae bacterium]